MSKDLFSFDTQGQHYHTYRPNYPKSLVSELINGVNEKNSYIDVAVGTGQLLFEIAPHFSNSEGVDKSHKMVAVCSQRVKENGLKNVEIKC
jgi:ubiquinone/menaquinone biosynthesis C-methylase UbiE